MTVLVPGQRADLRRVPDAEPWLFGGALAVIAVLALLPSLRLLGEALGGRGIGGADGTLDGLLGGGVGHHFATVFSQPVTWRATLNSLTVSAAGTVIALVLGSLFAILVGLTDLRRRRAMMFLFVLPLVIAPQVVALAWLQLLGPSSALLKSIGLAPPPGSPNPLYGAGGIALLLGIQYAPLVCLTLRAGLRGLPRELPEAARASGAGPVRTLVSVILPLMTPAVVAGTALTYVSCLGNFGVPAFLGIPAGYPVLPTLIYQRLAGLGPSVLPEVAVLGVLIGALAVAGVMLQEHMLRRRDFRVQAGAGSETLFPLGHWRATVECAVWAFLVVTVVLPMLALAMTSLLPALGVAFERGTLTLEHYRFVLFEHAATRRAFANSLLLSGAAAALILALSVPLAQALHLGQGRLVRAARLLVELPYALPGIVLALAAILLFIKPLPLLNWSPYNTLWIIFFCYLARFLVLGLRPVAGARQQMDPALEEAARVAGAGTATRLATIVWPSVAPMAVAGALMVFLTAFNELTVSALLWSSGNETLGVALFAFQTGGEATLAAALATTTTAVTLVLMLGMQWLGRALPSGVIPWRD